VEDMTQTEDKALAEFRGFAHIAEVYVDRVEDADTLDKLEDIVAKIQSSLQDRKKVLFSQ
jgi:hypothetical protein